MLKINAVSVLQHCARLSLRILGGEAYTAGRCIERINREVGIFALGGGTDEILREQAAKQLGLTGK